MVEINNQAAATTDTPAVKIPSVLEVELEFGKLFKEIAEWVVEAKDPAVTTATVTMVVEAVKQIHADVARHNDIAATDGIGNKNPFFQAPALLPIVVNFDVSVEPVNVFNYDSRNPNSSLPYASYMSMRFEYTNIGVNIGSSFPFPNTLTNGFVISVVTTDDQTLASYHLLQSISIAELFDMALVTSNESRAIKHDILGQSERQFGRYSKGAVGPTQPGSF